MTWIQIFRFVADEVRYEAYTGALRGAQGVLSGLAGNSVDKALLLSALLTEARIEVRFATGELDATGAGLLGDAAKMDLDLTKSETVRALSSGSTSVTTPSAAVPDDVAAFLETLPAKREQLVTNIRDQVTATVDLIQAALSASDISLAPSSGRQQVEQQHVWIQHANGTDWEDLDPSIPAAEVGTRYATLADTTPTLPDDLFHTVSFRLFCETADGSTVTRKDLLTYEARVADLVAVPVTLTHTKPGAFKGSGISIVGLIEGSTQYIPNLIVGADIIAGTVVGFDLGGSALSDARNAGDTLGEWLEVTIRTPGEPDRIVTRTVFDRVDPAMRLAGTIDSATIPPIELDTIPGLGEVFLPLEGVTAIAVTGGILPLAYFDQDYSAPDSISDMAGVPVAYHMLRASLSAELADQTGSHFYLDRANVTALWVTPNAVTADSIHHSVSIDLMHQSYAAAAVTGVNADVPAGLAAGALGHAVERAILENDVTFPGAPVLQTATSAGRVFDVAQIDRRANPRP